MTRLPLLFILVILNSPTFGQNDSITDLPASFEHRIKGIDIRITLLKLYGDATDSSADLVLFFRNPETDEWIRFEAIGAKFSSKGFAKTLS